MKKKQKYLLWLFLLLFAAACSTVAITGRKQLDLVSDSEILKMSFREYDDFLKTHQLSNDKKNARLVKKVGGKIAAAVEKYLRGKGRYNLVKDYKWEFNLVEDNAVNAWCMPGGKVVVYTGILPYTKNENGLAVVLGHEIAHAIARHGAERMSQELLRNVGGIALAVALNDKSPETRAAWMLAYGIGTQVGIMLPYSRLHESEADHLGLIFMAMAGYDPRGAVTFWERMAQSGGQKPPEFLSTHPSDRTRINNIKKLLPEALKYYKR